MFYLCVYLTRTIHIGILTSLLEDYSATDVFTFRKFSRRFCPKQLTVNHTYMVVAAMQGAVWVSVSCQRTFRHADQGNRPSDLLKQNAGSSREPQPPQTF